MTRTKPTVADLLAGKGTVQRTNIFVSDLDEVAAAEAAELDMLVVGDDFMSADVRQAAPNTFITAALAYGVHVTDEDYLRAGFAMYRLGADAVYCAAGLRTIERLADEGLPVVGHLGFIPTHATWTGVRAVGKTAHAAWKIWQQAQRLADAGAFAAEIEIVPAPVASAIADRSPLFLISMGSGSGCDAQYLFATDILGTNPGHVPRHAKQYHDLRPALERVQAERVSAFRQYRAEVSDGSFPEAGHQLDMAPDELGAFQAMFTE